jgi:hypothetical protein
MAKFVQNLSDTEKKFLKFVKSECKKYGVKLLLKHRERIKVGEKMWGSGYFDESGPTLAVACGRPDWLSILVHEYCHLTQWVDQIKEWKKANTYDSCWYMEKWLVGESVKNPYFHINNMRDIELDNEKRAVKLIKQHELDSIINLEKYIQGANAYVGYYNYMKTTRKWISSENSPYENKKLLKSMPTSFRMNHKKLSKKMFGLFVKSGV